MSGEPNLTAIGPALPVRKKNSNRSVPCSAFFMLGRAEIPF